MIRVAGRLFQEQGYNGTGVSQILDRSDAPRGSMYFHFPGGKQELAVEVIRQSADVVGEMLDALTDPASDLIMGLRRIVQVFIDQLEATDFKRGCPIASVALDVSSDDNPVRAACSEAYETWRAKLESVLRGRVTDPEVVALSVLSLVEGALLLAKTHHDARPLVVAQQALAKLLASSQTG